MYIPNEFACRASAIHAAPVSNCAVNGSLPSGVLVFANMNPMSGALDAHMRLPGSKIESNTSRSGPSVS